MFREQNWIWALALGLTYSIGGWAGEWVGFPKDLRWCVATAAHQVEGNNVHSDWWEWENQPGRIAHSEHSGEACDHWNRVHEDVDLMSKMGINTYRFSIEWANADSKDLLRPQFLKDHLYQVSKAIQKGIPVEMYCYWSLMDNFEWVEGFGPRFGLFETDYTTLKRIPRGSAALLQKIIVNQGFELGASPKKESTLSNKSDRN